jgi:hypothetical protein
MLERRRHSERVSRLGDRLAANARRRFCGRKRELDLFRRALAGSSTPFSVLYVYGMGGVGKSALLDQCANEAERAGVLSVHLDARHVAPSPPGFLQALGEAMALSNTDSVLERLSTEDAVVLTLDSYDALIPLDPWIRGTFLPMLPARGVLVIAGRQPPPADWAADPALGRLFRTLQMRNLSPAESRTLLSDRRVPDEQHDAVLAFTHGHPLALVLVADVIANTGRGVRFAPERAPNVVRELLARLVATVPTARHRKALEVCAQVRVTTEALLGLVIEDRDPYELFDWLRGLSFIEQSAEGLFPHDLAREVLDADFRWRDPDGYLEMHRRIWRHLRQKLVATSGRAQQRVFFDKLYLHRTSAIGARCHDYTSLGTVYAEAPTTRDSVAIVETVRRYEGEASATIAAHWLDRQPQGFRVARGPNDEMLGFVATIVVTEESSEDAAVDPALRAAWAFARRRGRLRPGEAMAYHRFHMACACYQQLSPNINLLALRLTLGPLQHRRLAWSFLTFAPSENWLPVMRYINFEHAEEGDFTVGGRQYNVFAHDWRVEPFEMWWDQLCERSLSTETVGEEAAPPPTSSLVVLSESEFATFVRQALRDYVRPAALTANPLARSRLVADNDGNVGDAGRLHVLLREALETLKTSPKDEKFYRALLYTYFQPAVSQEGAAERLGLPFNTYRYHLARGIQRISEWLWNLELSGSR